VLSNGELEAMRREVTASLPDTATVQRLNPQTFQWQTVGSWPCRSMPRRSVTRGSDGMLQGVTLWHVVMPWNAGVLVNDRLIIGSMTLTVTGTDAGRSEAVALTAQCTRIG
jgi:hypothetical protein